MYSPAIHIAFMILCKDSLITLHGAQSNSSMQYICIIVQVLTLDIFFHQIKSFIRFRLVILFVLQTL